MVNNAYICRYVREFQRFRRRKCQIVEHVIPAVFVWNKKKNKNIFNFWNNTHRLKLLLQKKSKLTKWWSVEQKIMIFTEKNRFACGIKII